MLYEDYVASKAALDSPTGFDFEIPVHALTNGGDRRLFDYQVPIVLWALRRGRAAIFADTGLGKTAMQSAWAYAVHQFSGSRVLIVAPLCVAPQTVEEASHFGIPIKYVRSGDEAKETGIYITNYEMLDHFEELIRAGYFDGVVLDESSILKAQDGKTRNRIIELCSLIPYRLSCTATPSPNDFMELGNQAEFLGVMKMTEMLSMFFVHDSGETSKWRLKGHGKERFWEWLASWAVCIRKPSDLGFSDDGYDLPELTIEEIVIKTDGSIPIATTLTEQNEAKKATIDIRVAEAARLANESEEPCIVWCHRNEESEKLTAAVVGSVEVQGAHKPSLKEDRLMGFQAGKYLKLVTKPEIAGFGLNWQHCNRMIFVGLNHSYEQIYQAIRRCYRFGQKRPVRVTLITADCEGAVLENIKRKESQHREMSEAMVAHMRDFTRRNVIELRREKTQYERDRVDGKDYTLHLADCVDVAREMPSDSIDFSVFSPPFASLYTYSNSDRDMGNVASHDEFWRGFQYLAKELFRVMKPGRVMAVHCGDLAASKQMFGYIGMIDFSGHLLRAFQREGFIFHSKVVIWKDPVVQMQRTKALGLLWKQVKKNSAMSRQGIPDIVIAVRKPGDAADPVSHSPDEFPVALWQQLASPCWMDIRQSNTLNRKLAREEEDERHICPLQLDLIERVTFLWSKPGDLVFSPFAGIGSEGYVATAMGRRFVGSELKRSYFDLAKKSLEDAPRSNYRFPRFSESVGGWKPGATVTPMPTRIAKPESLQMDIEDFISDAKEGA